MKVSWRFKTTDEPLGEGGFGNVHPCHRLVDGQVVDTDFAVKLFRVPDNMDPDEARTRFRNGGRLGKKLRHPNILPVVATGNRRADGTPFIVMPLASGNMWNWLADEQPTIDDIVDAFVQILGGVAHAHAQNILHRDLKPENILWLNEHPVVSDFDLAKDITPRLFSSGITATADGLGSHGYAAPEQWTDLKHCGPQADVYALGRLFWSMLTGERVAPVAPPNLLAVPAQFRAFIERATEQREDDRYGSAAEMLRALEAVVAAPPGSPKQPVQELVERWNRRETGDSALLLREINEHFRLHRDDDELHSDVAPFLPPSLLEAWMSARAQGFAKMVAGVDDACSGPLPWDDCDGFARFYLLVFEHSNDPQLRTRAIEQVLRIAATHNRYPVAAMLRTTLADIEDDDSAQLVAAAVDAQPEHARWFQVRHSVHPLIAEAFARVETAAA
ncbi:serine/threonine-protein kinase [Patulibacter medicamentivorans]|uniref:serine/threonine-protein kinase n=1 Tax=Patulibacter medicamentivorans TaxID=1097667 RepID=UPI00058F95CE|nr:serine/threonine-protein kinase [Patulibacter medicamentivorans]